ncbi:hypothetical protein JCM8202_004725 [Rhodotorula sphaerocarpa]
MAASARPRGSNGAAPPALAAPAWRQFSFWSCSPQSPPPTSSSVAAEWLAQPSQLACVHANPQIGPDGVVLVADLEGNLSLVNEQWEIEKSWRSYHGPHARTHMVETREWDPAAGRAIVVTVGEEPTSQFPLLKIWLLTLPVSSSLVDSEEAATPHLTLLRSSPISPTPGRPSPVSSLAVSPSLSHIIAGLADGSVVGWKRVDELIDASLYDLEEAAARANEPPPGVVVASTSKLRSVVGAGASRTFQPGNLGKLRVFWEGNKEPITNLGFTLPAGAAATAATAAAVPTLFILTTSQILALPLAVKSKAQAPPSVLDDHGAAVGCARVVSLGGGKGAVGGDLSERMVVARDEAIYVYGTEGREGCWAYEGPKSSIAGLHQVSVAQATPRASNAAALPTPYLVIVSPPLTSTLASNSATIRNHAARAPGTNGSGEEHVAKVTLFDPENKFVGYSGTFGDSGDAQASGVKEVLEAWGAVWILTEAGKLFRLGEQPLRESFATLFQRNLYTLAIGLAQSRGAGQDDVADIYKRYGDHLYSKNDYEGAMSAYLKTVGSLQASYVIRKFLDAQRLAHLTSYLQELHLRGLANTDITTLLLNCYTKLKDDEAISRFIHSSAPAREDDDQAADTPPFDLETAIRVLRQASYFSHAGWLAERYRAHGEYLRIAIEDTADFGGALRYVQGLARGELGGEDGRAEAEESMKRWGGVLLAHEPDLTTDVLVEICCGSRRVPAESVRTGGSTNGRHETTTANAAASTTTAGRPAGSAVGYDVPDESASTAPSSAPTVTADSSAHLPSPRAFFAHFVDHPLDFIAFLERVLHERYQRSVESLSPPSSLVGNEAPLPEPIDPLAPSAALGAASRDEQVVWNTLLELYVAASSSAEKPIPELQSKALKVLRCREEVPYDATQALLVCTTRNFEEGFVLLYELFGMYEEVVQYWIDASSAEPQQTSLSSRIVRSLRRYGPSCPSLYRTVLTHIVTAPELLSRHQADVVDILDEIDARRIMPAVEVVQILSKNSTASLGLVRDYLKRQLLAEKQETESDQALIASYRSETAKKRKEIQELSDPNAPRIFQVTRCSACGGQLDLPAVHFMCRHSYHQRCLGENESHCPNCARTHGVIREIRNSNAQLAGQHGAFEQEMAESDEPFATMANAFSRGWMVPTDGVRS